MSAKGVAGGEEEEEEEGLYDTLPRFVAFEDGIVSGVGTVIPRKICR